MKRERPVLTGYEATRVLLVAAAFVTTVVVLSQPDSGSGDTSRNGGNPGPQTIHTGLGPGFGR